MFRHSVAAFLLVAACSGSLYPRFEVVGRDPSQFDLLYSTTSGDHNETWYFTTQATVTAFIIPTRVDLSSGPGTNGTYMEDVELLIYHSYDDSELSLQGNGSYSGKVSMGQVLHIPVVDVRTGGEFIVGYKDLHYYILSIRFKTTGVYPWYQTPELYPLHEVAVRDPRSFDLLYSSTSGPHKETWHFKDAANLTAVIIPSQVFNFSSGGLWPGGTYAEELQVLVYETYVGSSSGGTILVGKGVFTGTAYFGRELRVPVRTANNTAIPVQEYSYANSGYSYIFSITFGSVGFYPWYNTRKLSTYSAVDGSSDVGGIALGIAFSDG